MSTNLWHDLYNQRTTAYERMIQHEDQAGNVLATLQSLHPLADATVVEFGAGTGRITTQLATCVKRIIAFDLTPPMIRLADHKLRSPGEANDRVGVADSRAMPVPSACADLAVEGWSLAQIMRWHPATWPTEIARAVNEMFRVVRPGGTVVLFETLGTGNLHPQPPIAFIPLYQYFLKSWQFSTKWISTDFNFASRAEAQDVLGDIFGEAVLEDARDTPTGVRVPECTGVWWRQV